MVGTAPVPVLDSCLPKGDLVNRLERHGDSYVMLSRNDVDLADHASDRLLSAALRVDADLAYCDEDVLVDGLRREPYFKPDFSIDLARSEDYVGPVVLVRAGTAVRLLESEPDSDALVYALLLRMYEARIGVAHLAEVLVHWRGPRDRTLSDDQRRCRSRHLIRCYGADLAASLLGDPVSLRRFTKLAEPLVSIVIPTRDRVDLLDACIRSIYRSDPQVSFEIVVLDNRSTAPESHAWFANAQERHENLRVIQADYDFNWSKLNNRGIDASKGRVILFLNNDVEVLTRDWLVRLAAQALRPDVGAVGALLLYPDGSVQHAGVVIGLGGLADHIYSGTPLLAEDQHIFAHPDVTRNVAVCTGACLAIERTKCHLVSGFDESRPICGDIVICVRLLQAGLLNVFDADVRLTHHESATRSRAPLLQEEVDGTMQACAAWLQRGDIYFNSNLSLRSRYPSLAVSASDIPQKDFNPGPWKRNG